MRGKCTQAGAGFNTQWLILLQSVKTHLASWNCDGFPHPDGIKTCRRKAKELSKHENNSSLRDTTAGKQTRTAPAEKGIHLHRCVTSFPQCFILPQFSGARSKTTLHKALYLDLFQKSSSPKEQSPLTFFLLFGCLGFFFGFFFKTRNCSTDAQSSRFALENKSSAPDRRSPKLGFLCSYPTHSSRSE